MYIPMTLIGLAVGVLNIVAVITIYNDTVSSTIMHGRLTNVDGWMMYLIFILVPLTVALTIGGLYYDTEVRDK